GAERLLAILEDPAGNPWQVISASLGIARVGNESHRPRIYSALGRLDWSKLDHPQKITWLRTVGLVFSRHGRPDDATRQWVITKIDASFPADDDELNGELCRMLAYLQAPGIVSRTLALMDSAGTTPAPDWLELARRNATYGRTVSDMIANL